MKKNSIFSDTLKVLKGQDLDAPKSKSTKSTAPAKKSADKSAEKSKAERKAQATKDAKSNALVYAASDALSKDVIAALADKGMSSDLKNLLEVLCDNSAVRETILAQGDVKPGPDEYYLEKRFINKDSRIANNEAAEKMLKGGMTLDELESFNIILAVVRKRKLDDEEIGEANDREYDQVRQEIKDTYYPD
jgi:hypothetical protein